jgi:hypothetical protein
MRAGYGVAIAESVMPYRAAQTFVALFPMFGSDSCFARVKSISSAAANHSGKRATSTSSVTSKRRPRWYPGASCSGVAVKTNARAPFVLCYYTVFNAEQCDGLTLPQVEQPTAAPEKGDDDCLFEMRWLYDRRDLEEALRDLAAWLGKWTERYPKLCLWVEEDIDWTLSF